MKSSNKKDIFNEDAEALLGAVLKLRNTSEAKRFLRDLLTEKELEEFSRRWKVARMLYKKIPYTKIEKETGMSSTTVARIQKWLKNGMSGYKLILDRSNKNT